MKDRFQNLRSKLSGRVAIGAALGVVGLAAAGTALAADKDSDKDSGKQPAEATLRAMPMPPGPPEAGVAVGFGGPPGADGVSDEFAQELSDHLDDVSADEISTALQEIADEHEAERRSEMADALAAELDGVDADAIADALQVAEDQMRSSFEDGDVPDPGQFAETLADELGLGADEVTKALEAAHQIAFEVHTDGAPGAIGVAPGMKGGFGPPPGADGDFTLPAPPPATAPGSGSDAGGSNN